MEKLSCLQSLRELVIGNCPLLTAQGLAYICRLDLTKLIISNVKGMHIEGMDIDKLKNIRHLSFCRANVTDATFKRLHRTVLFLNDLNLTGCKTISDTCVQSICRIRTLRSLSIISCIGVTNSAIASISKQLTMLEKLMVCGNFNLDDEGFVNIGCLKTLKTFDCSWTGISDVSLGNISSLSGLLYLNVSGCKVTDNGLLRLMALKKLKSLSVTHCELINGVGVLNLSMLSSLVELDIRYSLKIEDEIVNKLCKKSWKTLKVSTNVKM